ncbi:hypothetical protein BDZ94DRAFT_1276531, partial [Collybia nuda]
MDLEELEMVFTKAECFPLLAEKPKFAKISERLMDLNLDVLSDLIQRMEDGERVIGETDEEKLCFQLIKDLDHVGGHVKGSVTNKKYMRNEISRQYASNITLLCR